MMENLDIKVPVNNKGLNTSETIEGWMWHHDVGEGILRLVPVEQHTPGSIFWKTLHPDGRGGMFRWGGGYK